MDVFVVCTADDRNIGDAVLRRALLRALDHPDHRVHVYVSNASDSFLECMLYGTKNVLTYSTIGSWVRAFLAAKSKVSLIGKPGEVGVGFKPFLRHLTNALTALAVRSRGGAAIFAGSAFKSPPRHKWLYRPLFRAYNLVAWRDSQSAGHIGLGQQMPDWAFARTAMLPDLDAGNERNRLTISLRASTQISDMWLEAVTRFAQRKSLRLTVATQVRRDEKRGATIAAQLGAEFIGWNAETSPLEQERRVREIYRESVLVISDRLHALIMGMSEGAIPICPLERRDVKVQRHFDVVPLPDVATRVESAQNLEDTLNRGLARSADVHEALNAAVLSCDRYIARIATLTRD